MVEAEFKKQCEENRRTMSSIGGQKAWRQLRWQVAEAMYQGRWSNPNSYEVCVRGYKHLVKTVHAEDTKHPYLESTEAYEYAGKSLWEELQHKTSLHADFSKMPTGHQQNVFQVVADLCRLIKVETHLIVDIIMLSIPKVAGIADAGWGKCQICPYGLPLLQSGGNKASATVFIASLRGMLVYRLTMSKEHMEILLGITTFFCNSTATAPQESNSTAQAHN